MDRIIITKESRQKLVEKYGASNVTRALYFERNSMLSREIRHEAVNTLGAVIVNV